MLHKRIATLIGILSALMLLSISAVSAQAPIEIRWFVGLGTGTSPEQREGQQAIVDDFNASQDEIIPRAATESLWKSIGQPEIVWIDAGHITAARFLFDALTRVGNFFAEPADETTATDVRVVK